MSLKVKTSVLKGLEGDLDILEDELRKKLDKFKDTIPTFSYKIEVDRETRSIKVSSLDLQEHAN